MKDNEPILLLLVIAMLYLMFGITYAVVANDKVKAETHSVNFPQFSTWFKHFDGVPIEVRKHHPTQACWIQFGWSNGEWNNWVSAPKEICD